MHSHPCTRRPDIVLLVPPMPGQEKGPGFECNAEKTRRAVVVLCWVTLWKPRECRASRESVCVRLPCLLVAIAMSSCFSCSSSSVVSVSMFSQTASDGRSSLRLGRPSPRSPPPSISSDVADCCLSLLLVLLLSSPLLSFDIGRLLTSVPCRRPFFLPSI